MKAWHITAEGVITEIEVSEEDRVLVELSKQYFGGSCLALTKVIWHGKPTHMAVDDDGLLKQLRFNRLATEAYWAACKPGTIHYLAGDAVIFERLLD